jgi:hypothetical protein
MQYSSLDEAVTEQQLSGPTSGYPRAQAVVIAEGRTVWVSLVRDPDSGIWQVKAQEISTGIVIPGRSPARRPGDQQGVHRCG